MPNSPSTRYRCRCEKLAERTADAIREFSEALERSSAGKCEWVRGQFSCRDCGGTFYVGAKPSGVAKNLVANDSR